MLNSKNGMMGQSKSVFANPYVQSHDAPLLGPIIQAPAMIARTTAPGSLASHVPVVASAPVPAQPVDDNAVGT